jgi:hypothetical protein
MRGILPREPGAAPVGDQNPWQEFSVTMGVAAGKGQFAALTVTATASASGWVIQPENGRLVPSGPTVVVCTTAPVVASETLTV